MLPRQHHSVALAAVLARITLATVTLLMEALGQSSHAADVCPNAWGHECSWGNPFPPHFIQEMGIYGFATSDVPCQGTITAGHRVFISSSAIDPNVHTGPITDASLYLWMYSGADYYGYGWASSQTTFTGDIHVAAFEPIPPGDGFFQGPQLVFWYDAGGDWSCPQFGWGLVGRLIVQLPVAVEPQTWGRMKALYR